MDNSIKSENSFPLQVVVTSEAGVPSGDNDVHVFYLGDNDSTDRRHDTSFLSDYAAGLGPQAVLCVIGSPIDLVRVHEHVSPHATYQLWVVLGTPPVGDDAGRVPRSHRGMVVYTRYTGTLKHCVTRAGYTFCPACDKTTKDYGGKKHTFHEFGTLISDVWRDIGSDEQLFSRVASLFGTEPHKSLNVHDLRGSDMPLEALPVVAVDAGVATSVLPSMLINGDCIAELKKLPDNSVDFVFVDPPYNLKKNYSNYADDMEINNYFKWCDEWLAELTRVLKPGRTLAILNIPLWSIRHFRYMETVLKFQNWIAWDGPSLPVRKILPSHYAIVCFSKGEPRPLPMYDQTGLTEIPNVSKTFRSLQPVREGYCSRQTCVNRHERERSDVSDLWWDVHRLKHNGRRVDHPCQLPPTFMYRLYSMFTKPGELVLDCFNGAGTSTLTAFQIEREYIGIELSGEYHDIAESRHREMVDKLDPFRKVERKLTVKNSHVPRVDHKKYKVSKKLIQLDVKRVKEVIGRMPKRDDYIVHGKYEIEYLDAYFHTWADACAAARTTGMVETRTDSAE
jgi:DNA modification methylase